MVEVSSNKILTFHLTAPEGLTKWLISAGGFDESYIGKGFSGRGLDDFTTLLCNSWALELAVLPKIPVVSYRGGCSGVEHDFDLQNIFRLSDFGSKVTDVQAYL